MAAELEGPGRPVLCDFCGQGRAGGQWVAFGCEPFTTMTVPTDLGATMRAVIPHSDSGAGIAFFTSDDGHKVAPADAGSPAADLARQQRAEMTGDWIACPQCAPLAEGRFWHELAQLYGPPGPSRAAAFGLWLAFGLYATGRADPVAVILPPGGRLPQAAEDRDEEQAAMNWAHDAYTGGQARIWLDVPYSNKHQAKAAGALWDPRARRWYAPPGRRGQLSRWLALPDLPSVLPGEDRSFGSGLFVDLIPAPCWFASAANCLREESWDRVRRMVYGRAGQQCEACGASRAGGAVLEAHERYFYDERRRVQSLRRLICLCRECHRVTHFGKAGIDGVSGEAFRHLARVTGWTQAQADAHIEEAFETWHRRSAQDWRTDMGILSGYRLRLTPEAAAARAASEARQAPAGARDGSRAGDDAAQGETGPAGETTGPLALPPEGGPRRRLWPFRR
ncbi:MAG TPA: DUF5710 domain-containing protein [Streptosporangiaceae bacterium]|nr:DUF5710 domain-containing protein [Streptosporangiaceae bacterium]